MFFLRYGYFSPLFLLIFFAFPPERSPDGTGEAASSMVGMTLPAIPSVRIAKSRQFSMPKRAYSAIALFAAVLSTLAAVLKLCYWRHLEGGFNGWFEYTPLCCRRKRGIAGKPLAK